MLNSLFVFLYLHLDLYRFWKQFKCLKKPIQSSFIKNGRDCPSSNNPKKNPHTDNHVCSVQIIVVRGVISNNLFA